MLEGITRDTILRFADELGLQVNEKRITRDEIYIADEAFLTGTAAEVTPVREVDGRAMGRVGAARSRNACRRCISIRFTVAARFIPSG